MSIRITKVLSWEEYCDLGEWAVKNGFYRNDRRVFKPGYAWFNKRYYDPDGKVRAMVTSKEDNAGFLSIHYWRDWADKRPPIEIVMPNGDYWCPDRKSSNGTGWTVTGELPNVTCTPSIVSTRRDPPYHGFLTNGCFSDDLDGNPPYDPGEIDALP